MNIGALLRRAAVRFSDHSAVVDQRRKLTYSQLDDEANRLANWTIAAGFRKGDAVALMLRNSVEYVVSIFAMARAGLVSTHIAPQYSDGEAHFLSQKDRVQGAIVTDEAVSKSSFMSAIDPRRVLIVGQPKTSESTNYADVVSKSPPDDPGIEVSGYDPFFNGHTSGTTGDPKTVVISHQARVLGAITCAMVYGFRPSETHVMATPLHHGAPLDFAVMCLLTGGELVLEERFDAEQVRTLIQETEASHMFVVPTILYRLLDTTPDICRAQMRSLRTLVCNAAALPDDLKRKSRELIPWVDVWEAYGSTEAGWMTALPPGDLLTRPGSCGKPLPLVDLKIVGEAGGDLGRGEIGRVFVRSPFLFDGYLGQGSEEISFTSEWLETGDLGQLDRGGNLYLAGRADDLFISGGVNIHPREIETILRQHQQVRDVVVVGVPDEEWGAVPVAAVVTRTPTDEQLIRSELMELVGGALSRLKHPKQIIFMTEFPLTSSGKIIRRDVIEQIAMNMERATQG